MTRTLRLAKPPLVIRVSSFFQEQLKDFWLERVRCNLKRPRHTSVQFSVIGTVLDFHFNAALATLNLARAEDLRTQTAPSPQVFSMASWKQRHFNERLLDLFIDRFALDATWIKNHPDYEELRTYGAIAA